MDDNKVLIDEQNLYDIADAIRRKNGETVKYLPEEMPPAIDAIPTSEDSNLAGNLAIAYDGLTFPVQVGTHCIYDSNYYICTVAIAGTEPFTLSHWTRITAGVEIEVIKHYIHDMSPVATVGPVPVVSVSEAAPLDAEGLVVDIEPVQDGTGDPSPDNVRPITGWTGANVSVNGNVINVTFPSEAGTVYSGTLDVVKGVCTVTHMLFERNSSTMNNTDPYPGWRDAGVRAQGFSTANYSDVVGSVGNKCAINTSGLSNDIVYLPKSAYGLEQPAWIAMAVNVQFALPLPTPITYQLTPQEIALLRGNNTIYADCGNTTLSYRQDVGLLLQALTTSIRNISP